MSDARTGLPIRLFDEDNLPYTANNPLPVTLEESEGDEIHDFENNANVLKNGGSANQDYTVTAAKTLLVNSVLIAGSGRAKFTLQIETGVATGIYTDKAVGLISTAKLSDVIPLAAPIKVGAGIKVRVAKVNLDNEDQDLYATIVGIEK